MEKGRLFWRSHKGVLARCRQAERLPWCVKSGRWCDVFRKGVWYVKLRHGAWCNVHVGRLDNVSESVPEITCSERAAGVMYRERLPRMMCSETQPGEICLEWAPGMISLEKAPDVICSDKVSGLMYW